MRAMVWTGYGPPEVLQLQEVDKPVPQDNEVLIKVCAATVTAGDCEARRMEFPMFLSIPMRFYLGLRKPRKTIMLGQELAGEVEAVGAGVNRFKPGDRIFGTTGFRFGAYAKYCCLAEESGDGVLATMPANITCDEAAAVPTGGLEALHFLRKAKIKPGERVLIKGAGGSIGTAGVQIARYYGAEVTAVDSAEKLAMLRELGAAHVVDYKTEDFTRSGKTWNVILDVVGSGSFSGLMRALAPRGRLLIANPRIRSMVRGKWASATGDRKVIFAMADRQPGDLDFLRDLIEAGKFKVVIDRRYPLEQVAEAHRYVETGKKQGNVVITVMS